MELTPYVVSLRHQLVAAAALGDEEAQVLAGRLAVALEPATRMALLEALSRAADEITTHLAPGSVEVSLRGGDPTFVVRLPDRRFEELAEPVLPQGVPPVPGSTDGRPAGSVPTSPPGVGEGEDRGQSRISLRLPDHLKVAADAAATAAGMSLNAWLTRVVAAAVEAPSADGVTYGAIGGAVDGAAATRGVRRAGRSTRGGRYTGWAR